MALPLRLESYLAAAEEWAEEQGAVSLEERFRGMKGRASLAVVPLSFGIGCPAPSKNLRRLWSLERILQRTRFRILNSTGWDKA